MICATIDVMNISVITHPNSKKPRVEADLLGMLHVYVMAPPLEGKANLAAIETLAKHFGVKKSDVTLLSGHTNKHKRFEIRK